MARNLATEGHDVTLVSKDLPLRLKASVVGLDADEYRNELASDTSWTGFVTLEVESGLIDELFDARVVDLEEARVLPCNTGLALVAGSQSALARVHDDKRVRLVSTERELFGIRGRSAEQRSRSICWPTTTSASSRSVATPVRARACSRWPPRSKRCSNSARTNG